MFAIFDPCSAYSQMSLSVEMKERIKRVLFMVGNVASDYNIMPFEWTVLINWSWDNFCNVIENL